jgi:NAD+ kinase
VTHGRRATIGDALSRLACLAAERDVQLVFPADERGKHDLERLACQWAVDEGEDADIALVLGGDGTTLRALQRFLGRGIPVFAVNYGHFGFLTSAPAHDLESAVGRALAGEVAVLELPTLEVRRPGGEAGLVVNDAVVTGGVHGRTANLGWSVDDVDLGEVSCDAIVVATPAGSTAYSLSAGGPVLGWGLEGLCTTFVAPHSLAVRSFVLGSGQCISVRNASRDLNALLVLDGHAQEDPLPPGAEVGIQLSDRRARLALLPEVSPLERFRDAFSLLGERRWRQGDADG